MDGRRGSPRCLRLSRSTERSGRTEGRALALVSAVLLLASTVPISGCLTDDDLGAWTALSTKQFAVPLASGTTTVEVRDTRDGWVERVTVESDGRAVTDGIKLEPLQPAQSRTLSDEDAAYLRGDAAYPIPTTGAALDRALALNAWVGQRVERLRLSQSVAPSSDETDAGPPSGPAGGTRPVADFLRPAAPSRPREGEPPIDSDNACEVLRSIADGARSNCRSYATIFCDAATLAGLTVRRVDMAVRYGSPLEGHSLDEVWSPELAKWIVVDPLFQAMWTVDGAPAAAIELHRAAVEGRLKSIDFRSTGIGGASLSGSRVNPRLYPRCLFVRTTSGAWLTRTAGAPAPVEDTNILQCDDDAVFAAPPGAIDAYSIRRDSLHGRIAFQAVDGRLVVGLAGKTFEPGRFEARVSTGRSIELFDDIVGYDPGDPEIATGPELLPETRLSDDDGDRKPDGWVVKRAPSGFETRPDGTAVLESGPDGALLTLKPKGNLQSSVVGFARLAVERGYTSFSLSGRLKTAPFTVAAGRETTACSPISSPGAAEGGLRLELAPNSRVTVAWVSLRASPRYGEPTGASVP